METSVAALKPRKNLIDLNGRKFGRLTVIYRAENVKGRACWVAQCSCGELKVVPGDQLRRGMVKSCGCLRRENFGPRPDRCPQCHRPYRKRSR